jgi:hypothetical protein
VKLKQRIETLERSVPWQEDGPPRFWGYTAEEIAESFIDLHQAGTLAEWFQRWFAEEAWDLDTPDGRERMLQGLQERVESEAAMHPAERWGPRTRR